MIASKAEPQDNKPPEHDSVYLASVLAKALSYANCDPETSLIYARKSAECICTDLFKKEVGDPGNNRLDKLIELLSNKDTLPERIRIPFRVIQQYGNYAAHVQTDRKPIDRPYITPCLSALVQVSNWFFLEYLTIPIPSDLKNVINEFDPQPGQTAKREEEMDFAIMAKDLGSPFPLRQYQWEGVNFLAKSDAALLADEMGLGKTVQSITALRLLLRSAASKRALIIAPSSLICNWENELGTWAPELTVRRVRGSSNDRLYTYQLPIQVLIASLEQIRADGMDIDPSVQFEVVIIDEAQRIKNRHSRSALACRLLARNRSWALSGTPLENNLDDLVSLFTFLKPGIVDAGMPPREVHSRIKPHFLRRKKKEVLSEMPPILIQDVPLELSGAQSDAYDEVWIGRRAVAAADGMPAAEASLFALITKLKQLCNYDPVSEESVKMDALAITLEECAEADDKIIIFSQYVQTLEFISKRMGNMPHGFYTGQISEEAKEKTLEDFKKLPGPRALLISLRAGGVGLNIQEASTVVMFDRWWNPAVENQAIQRAHRFGRTGPLHVIRFLTKDTIEERIQEVLKGKEMEFDRFVEQAENAPVKLMSRSELRQILGLSIIDTDSTVQ